MSSERQSNENRKLVASLLVVVVGAFAFGYALVPLYEEFLLRGYMLGRLNENFRPGEAVILIAFLFGFALFVTTMTRSRRTSPSVTTSASARRARHVSTTLPITTP